MHCTRSEQGLGWGLAMVRCEVVWHGLLWYCVLVPVVVVWICFGGRTLDTFFVCGREWAVGRACLEEERGMFLRWGLCRSGLLRVRGTGGGTGGGAVGVVCGVRGHGWGGEWRAMWRGGGVGSSVRRARGRVGGGGLIRERWAA